MRVLVTGGKGFIGSHVVDKLWSEGHEPVIFSWHHDMHNFMGNEVILGDVRDRTAVQEAVAHVDAVIHLAAVLGTQETIDTPMPSVETNIHGSLNVFEAAALYDRKVVYIGVGNHFMASQGGGAYTISKTAAENFAYMFNANRGTDISVVRPCNAYGPGQSIAAPFGSSVVRKIMPSFICRALCGMPIEVYGDGRQISDIVHVHDVARVLVAALEAPAHRAGREAIGVGPRDSVTVMTIAGMVAQVVYDLIGGDMVTVECLPMRRGEVPNAIVAAEPTNLIQQLGIDPDSFIDYETGILETVRWLLAEEGKSWNRP